MGIGPQDQAVDPPDSVQHVVMVVPVDRHIDEAEHIAEEDRQLGRAAPASRSPCGTFSSSTMMVMMMAITPSLNAVSRSLFMLPRGGGNEIGGSTRTAGAHWPQRKDFNRGTR